MIHNLTHFDLDGAVCAIVLKQIYKDIEIKPISYNKYYLEVTPFIRTFKKSIITDLNFDENYYKELIKSKNNILYIDHHIKCYRYESTKNIKIYNNEKYCGAANVLSYFKNKYSFDDSIKKLVMFTNDYDMWLLKTKESQILNYIFWKEGFYKFIDIFSNGFSNEIIEKYLDDYMLNQQEIKTYLGNADKYEIENTGYKILVIYSSKYINDITLLYPNYDYYFIITDPTKLSVRCKSGFSIGPAFDDIQKMPEIENAGCHDFAGGINIRSNYSNEELIDIQHKIIKTIISYGIPF